MRFLMSVIDAHSRSATGDEMAAIDAFNESLQNNGHWIMACGIEDPSSSVVFDNRASAGLISQGPLHDTDEFMAGFWLIQADDIATARKLAAEGSRACNRKVELRQLHG